MCCWCYSDNQLSSIGPMNGTSIQCKSPEPHNPHADRSMRKDSDWSAPEQDSHVIHPSAIQRNYHKHIHTNIFQTVNAWPLRWSRQRRIQTRATAGSIKSASRDLSKHIFYIPTPARSEKKKGITEEEESVNRMQLNGDFKLLSVGSWACYSRKRHRNWDGYAKLQEGKSRPSAVSGNDGRCACAVLRSSMESRKADFSNRSLSAARAHAGFAHPRHTYQ